MFNTEGKITTIIGPMCAGKSKELIHKCHLLSTYGMKKVIVYKPENDTRFSKDSIVSRSGESIEAVNIPTEITKEIIDNILEETKYYDVIGFDEGNFYTGEICELILELSKRGKEVYVAGLNLDYRGHEFGHMGRITLMSNEIVKLHAYCACCGGEAKFTQRLENGVPAKLGELVVIGGDEAYEPRCLSCYVPPDKA